MTAPTGQQQGQQQVGQQVGGGTNQPQVRTTSRGSRIVRRRPVPLGTVSIGAVAATGTAVTAAATVLSPVGAVAVVAAAAVVPVAAVIRRTRRHRASSRGRLPFGGRGGGFGGRLGFGNPFRGLGGGRGGGRGRSAGRGRGAGIGNPLAGLGGGTGGTRGTRGTRGAGSHRAGRTGGPRSSHSLGLGGSGRSARSPRSRTAGTLAAVGRPLRAAGRGTAAAARGAANAARAARAGTQTQGGFGAAAKGAWNAAGAGRPRTFAGRLGRLVIGSLGACGAVGARLAGRLGRGAWGWLRGLYQVAPQQNPASYTPPSATRLPSPGQTPQQPHPVPPPRRAIPNRGGAFPAAVPQPVGGSVRFVPAGIAADMENMCRQWRPGTGTGALGVFQDALPGIVDMVTWSAAAFHHVMKNSAEDLPRTLNPNFVKTTAEVYKLLFKAHQFATELPRQFEAMHQEFVYRRNLQGGHTANVGAGTPAG